MIFPLLKGNDLTIYEDHATEWWDRDSYYFKSLLNITPFRFSLIDEALNGVAGKRIIDLGCGGGLLAVPLINDGADLIGVDISPKSVNQARLKTGGRGKFVVADIRDVLLEREAADAVIIADVLDHISDYWRVIEIASKAVKPGGVVFISTINRTVTSWFLAILLGEGLRLIPRGTHDHNLFIKPKELSQVAARYGLKCVDLIGEKVLVWPTLRDWAIHLKRGASTSTAYSMVLKKL